MSGRVENIRKNVEMSHQATVASRIRKTGLTDRKTELSSKNFEKMMRQRGLSEKSIEELKGSNDQGVKMQVRHARAGETFITTHGTSRSSGIFVLEKSLGKTQAERIDKGALPHGNSAEYETRVELMRDQNVIYGKIAPQNKFSKMDPEQNPRRGGGEQVITDGGYDLEAVRNKDSKYPIPAKEVFLQRAEAYKEQNGISVSKGNEREENIKGQSHAEGQCR